MSSAPNKPDLPLLCALLYTGNGYPFTAGAMFTFMFGSGAQREYGRLKERFGNVAVAGFFAQFESYFAYVMEEDPAAKTFLPAWKLSPGVVNVRAIPDPAVNLAGYVVALHAAGSEARSNFSGDRLLDRLLTPDVRRRADEHLDHAYGAGTSGTFAKIFGAIVVDGWKTSLSGAL
jgi:hypothetical protein